MISYLPEKLRCSYRCCLSAKVNTGPVYLTILWLPSRCYSRNLADRLAQNCGRGGRAGVGCWTRPPLCPYTDYGRRHYQDQTNDKLGDVSSPPRRFSFGFVRKLHFQPGNLRGRSRASNVTHPLAPARESGPCEGADFLRARSAPYPEARHTGLHRRSPRSEADRLSPVQSKGDTGGVSHEARSPAEARALASGEMYLWARAVELQAGRVSLPPPTSTEKPTRSSSPWPCATSPGQW
jgi:hypothetical protein